jgi:hypothetical protein
VALGNKKSENYDAMLVDQARLHLSTVINGYMSELFFETMDEIIKRRVYLGYRTARGKDVKLSGIKDFFYNFHYGLGIKNLPEFLSACAKIDSGGQSKGGEVRRFIDWLQKTDPKSFEFPDYYWELRRLRIAIAKMDVSKEKKNHYASMLRTICINEPESLIDIGYGRKYKSIPVAYDNIMQPEKRKILTPIKLFRCPTVAEVEELARQLYSRLDRYKTRVLIARLIEVYKLNDAIEKNAERHSETGDTEQV